MELECHTSALLCIFHQSPRTFLLMSASPEFVSIALDLQRIPCIFFVPEKVKPRERMCIVNII